MVDRMEKARRNMVDSQIRPNDVTRPDIVQAFLSVPREAFVAKSKESLAYSELEIETSTERALWTPRDFAKLVDALEPQPEDEVLIIGCGAGYECAIMSQITTVVIGLDDDEARVSATTERLTNLGYDHVACVSGDLRDGVASEAPFDIILINGMVEAVPPALLDQLGEGGRLGAVIGTARLGKAYIYSRAGEAVSHRPVFEATPPRFSVFDKPKAFNF
jgi:protein-L-isoaspartate(D-aspartate) O-methyltransferase